MAFLSKYGTARHIYITIPKAGSANHAVGADWTPAAGDVKISKDGGAAANVTNLPTAIAMGNSAEWDFSLTATEMQAAQIVITVSDSATKAVDDTGFIIETYGNASAQHALDLGTALSSQTVSAVSGAVGSVTGAVGSIAANGITEASFDTTAGSFIPLGIVDQGTAQSATTTQLVIRAAAAFGDNALKGCLAYVFGSTQGYWQESNVTANVGSTDTLTLDPPLVVAPTGTITYKLVGLAAELTTLPDVNVAQITGSTTDATRLATLVTDYSGGTLAATISGIAGTITTLDSLASKELKRFQLMVRKDAAIATDNATELGELNANNGSGAGTFDNTTDSEQALRDNMPANFSTLTISSNAVSAILANAAHGGVAATITFERMIGAATTAGEPCIKVTGNAAGAGILSTGGANGDGVEFVGGGFAGHGIHAHGIGTAANGLFCESGASGAGICAQGGSTAAGLQLIGNGADDLLLASSTSASMKAAIAGAAMTLTSAYDWAKGTTAMAELTVDPGATPTPQQALMLQYMLNRNKMTTTATSLGIFNSAGTQILSKALTDDGTTYTEAKVA